MSGQFKWTGSEADGDAKSMNSQISDFGTLEEDMVKSSSFSITVGSFIKKHTKKQQLIAPRSVDLNEY